MKKKDFVTFNPDTTKWWPLSSDVLSDLLKLKANDHKNISSKRKNFLLQWFFSFFWNPLTFKSLIILIQVITDRNGKFYPADSLLQSGNLHRHFQSLIYWSHQQPVKVNLNGDSLHMEAGNRSWGKILSWKWKRMNVFHFLVIDFSSQQPFGIYSYINRIHNQAHFLLLFLRTFKLLNGTAWDSSEINHLIYNTKSFWTNLELIRSVRFKTRRAILNSQSVKYLVYQEIH